MSLVCGPDLQGMGKAGAKAVAIVAPMQGAMLQFKSIEKAERVRTG